MKTLFLNPKGQYKSIWSEMIDTMQQVLDIPPPLSVDCLLLNLKRDFSGNAKINFLAQMLGV